LYAGGTGEPDTQVVLYLQHVETGETRSQLVPVDRRGEWFYRYENFLSNGQYRIWVQGKLANQLSPPSAQQIVRVEPTAFEFQGSRLSYPALYGLIIVLLSLLVCFLVAYILYHWRHARKKHKELAHDLGHVEASVKRAYVLVRREIKRELDALKQSAVERALSPEEKQRTLQLLKDLRRVERHVAQEIWEMERLQLRF
jgi:hypothetical protein